jgi:hypothetical protein
MKKNIFTVAVLTLLGTGLYAQETFPIHTISKDVQKIQFRGAAYKPSTMTTGNLENVASKGVAKIQRRQQPENPVIIIKGGTPSHVISKGVARMQYERENK